MPAFLPLGTAVCSDTWDGFSVSSILVSSAAPVSSLYSVEIQFRSDRTQASPDFSFTSPNSGMTILNASSYSVAVDPVKLTAPADTYYWDMTFTALNGEVNTYINGSLIILNGVDEDE